MLLSGLLLLTLAVPATAADRDRDGLRDGFETRWGVTDPDRRDSDRDGVIDGAEDSDKDGLGNLGEQRFGTDPSRKDTDRDGISDAREDHDRDGRSNAREQDQRPVPSNLKPALSKAAHDKAPNRADCLTPNGRSWPVACAYGSKDSPTRVVLVGDSHAIMWSSAIREAVAPLSWRLTIMTKGACPPVLGIHVPSQFKTDRGKSCRAWRRNVIDKLQADPPDLIVLASSDSYKLLTIKGAATKRSARASIWKQGLKRTIAALPQSSRVLVLGDVPHNSRNPRGCLSRNKKDMSACVSYDNNQLMRQIEDAWRQAAKDKGAQFRTLKGKICSYQPCPLVQGNILMWRDKGHITEKFAVQLTPAVRTLLEQSLSSPAQRR